MKAFDAGAWAGAALTIGIGAAALTTAAVDRSFANPRNKWTPSVDPSYGGDGSFRWPWEAPKSAAAAPRTLDPSETLLLESTEDALENKIAYPTAGDARVTATMLTLEPGQRSKVLEHSTPMFGYVLEGEITLNYGRKGAKAYRAGDSMLQPMNSPFRTINSGGATAKVLLVSMSATGADAARVVDE